MTSALGRLGVIDGTYVHEDEDEYERLHQLEVEGHTHAVLHKYA